MDVKDLKLTALVFQDGNCYSALCLELDVASFGDTPDAAFESLKAAVHEYVSYVVEQGKEEMLHRPVPQHVISQIRRQKKEKLPKQRFAIKYPDIPPLAVSYQA